MYGRWAVGEKSWGIYKSCDSIHRCMVGGLWERRVGIYVSLVTVFTGVWSVACGREELGYM